MILITGANGFVGRHVVADLEKKVGAENIRILLFTANASDFDSYNNIQIVHGDISNEADVRRAVQGVDTIIHLASKNIDADETGLSKVNVEGTQILCETAVSSGVKRIIYLSTTGVYGHHVFQNADETTPTQPDTPFSHSKAKAEQIILKHHNAKRLGAFILRPRFIYGKGDKYFIPRIIHAMQKYPFLIGGGKAKMSLIFVDDLANIISLFATGDKLENQKPVYHITDGVPITYYDVIFRIHQAYSLRIPKVRIPFRALYIPLRLHERLFNVNPETKKSSLSSIRIKLIGRDNYFSNAGLSGCFPQLTFTSFQKAFSDLEDYYEKFTAKRGHI